MADVYISFSSADRDRVEPLIEAIESMGWSVWLDNNKPEGIVDRKKWRSRVQRELDLAICVVVVLSKSSIVSEWVSMEIQFAEENKRELFPVLIDQVEFPPSFEDSMISNLVGWNGGFNRELKLLLVAIGELVEVARGKRSTSHTKKQKGSQDQSVRTSDERSSSSKAKKDQSISETTAVESPVDSTLTPDSSRATSEVHLPTVSARSSADPISDRALRKFIHILNNGNKHRKKGFVALVSGGPDLRSGPQFIGTSMFRP